MLRNREIIEKQTPWATQSVLITDYLPFSPNLNIKNVGFSLGLSYKFLVLEWVFISLLLIKTE